MKNSLKIFIVSALSFLSIGANAQNYSMTNGSISGCSGTFYDSGGSGGSYSNSESYTFTICPSTPGDAVIVDFSAFDIESGFDNLYIYNGSTTGAPLIGQYTGTNSPGTVVATNDCLTFVFTSDGSVTYTGWAASISCYTPGPATCSDGIQNQGETGVDCGGPCPACTNISITMGGTQSLCSGTFYDPGGPGGDYGNSQNYTITLCSDQPGDEIYVTFSQFDLEDCCDNLYIYDGPTTASPQVSGSPFNSTSPGTVGSTNGCLTFVFTSDGSVTALGWLASISCNTPSCTDGIQNQGETGIDCGGPCPTACPPPPPGGGTDCSNLGPICTDVGLNFTANSGGTPATTADPGNNYDCLFSSPNPSWYYLQVATNGAIDMSLTAPSDIDFIIM